MLYRAEFEGCELVRLAHQPDAWEVPTVGDSEPEWLPGWGNMTLDGLQIVKVPNGGHATFYRTPADIRRLLEWVFCPRARRAA